MTLNERSADELPYGDAVDELERILAELEHDDLDVDALASKVRRAADLIRACRARIAGAQLEIERVVAELEAEAGDTT